MRSSPVVGFLARRVDFTVVTGRLVVAVGVESPIAFAYTRPNRFKESWSLFSARASRCTRSES